MKSFALFASAVVLTLTVNVFAAQPNRAAAHSGRDHKTQVREHNSGSGNHWNGNVPTVALQKDSTLLYGSSKVAAQKGTVATQKGGLLYGSVYASSTLPSKCVPSQTSVISGKPVQVSKY